MIHLEKFFGLSETYSDTVDCWYTHLHLTHLEKFPTVFDDTKPDEVVFLPDTLNDVNQIEEKLKELVAIENREQYGKEFLKEFEQNHFSITDADQLRRYLERVYYRLFWLRQCTLSLWEKIGDTDGKKWKWSVLQEENGRLHSHYWGYLDWAVKEIVKVADERGVYLDPVPEYNIVLEYIRPTDSPPQLNTLTTFQKLLKYRVLQLLNKRPATAEFVSYKAEFIRIAEEMGDKWGNLEKKNQAMPDLKNPCPFDGRQIPPRKKDFQAVRAQFEAEGEADAVAKLDYLTRKFFPSERSLQITDSRRIAAA